MGIVFSIFAFNINFANQPNHQLATLKKRTSKHRKDRGTNPGKD